MSENEQIWYVYNQGNQVGPFATGQLTQLIDGGLVAQDAYVFRVGWKDWRPIEDVYEELGLIAKSSPATSSDNEERRKTAPRASVDGQVIVHNNGKLTIGSGVNISTTGIFVETSDQLFKIGENLKLTVKISGLASPFNAKAEVIRFNLDERFPIGYGLRFLNLEEEVVEEIRKLAAANDAVAPISQTVGH